MPINFIAQLLISAALYLLSAVLAPKPKAPAPEAVKDFEGPQSESGIPIPVVFGEVEIQSPNTIFQGEKAVETYKL